MTTVAMTPTRAPASASDAAMVSPDPIRMLKEALFACLKTGFDAREYGGVLAAPGKYAYVRFTVEDKAAALSPAVVLESVRRAGDADDGLGDGRAICEALGFDPTNHHNALRCPYCNPKGLRFAEGEPTPSARADTHTVSGGAVEEPGRSAFARWSSLTPEFQDRIWASMSDDVRAFWIKQEDDQAIAAVMATPDAAILAGASPGRIADLRAEVKTAAASTVAADGANNINRKEVMHNGGNLGETGDGRRYQGAEISGALPGDHVDSPRSGNHLAGGGAAGWKPGQHGIAREATVFEDEHQIIEIVITSDGRIDLVIHRANDSGAFDDLTARLTGKQASMVVAALVEAGAAAPAAPEPPADGGREIAVDVVPMRLSDGRTDYFVRIRCGDREVTPHVFRERYKAEYEAAHYAWIFGLRGDEPELMAYDEKSHPTSADAGAEGGQD